MELKTKPTRKQVLARERNYAKFLLSGVYYNLKSILSRAKRSSHPLLDKERVAIESLIKDIEGVLEDWKENYIKLKESVNKEATLPWNKEKTNEKA